MKTLLILELAGLGLAAYFCVCIVVDTFKARFSGVMRSRAFIVGGSLGAVGLLGWLFSSEKLHLAIAPWGGFIAAAFAILTWAMGRKR
jgi:hypothetical protein